MMLLIGTLILGGGVTVTLPMEAYVRGTEIELREIAEITGEDAALIQRVGDFELGYAPAPGYSRVFVAERIRQTLARKLPEVHVRFAGQRACRVFPEVEEVATQEILTAARVELIRGFGASEATFEPSGQLAPVSIPAGAAEYRLRANLNAVPHTTGTISVPVELLVDGARYRTVWTSWDVKVWEVRPVLARPVRAGEVLRAEMFERRRVLVGENQGRPLDGRFVLGAVALRDLAPGELITTSDVNRPVVVTLGETIFLRVKKGSIVARVTALALESGAVGDRIHLRTTESTQELVARVVSRDFCELVLGK